MRLENKNELAEFLFHQGTNYKAYELLGAHPSGDGIVFRVWAPSADAVSVVGDFNAWTPETSPMKRVTAGGVWEARISREVLGSGDFTYKYVIRRGDRLLFKADPYGYFCECPPATASVYHELGGFQWHDDGWMKYRKEKFGKDFYKQPVNVYELHAGSWKRHADGSLYDWREIGEELAPYVKQMGYTHVELLPVAEHPFDGSWGYQVTGYYAPTARFGAPQDFMAFVDKLHTSGIGVILDWVPAHFPKDAHGLYEFDGAPLYEYQGWDRIEHTGWGTRRFDVGRNEVQSFLVSNADFWVRYYHVDGLRVDAVASMLYLDYDRMPGDWIPNVHGDNRCLEAEAFFKKLNAHMRGEFPDVLMIAEESSNWANLTGSPEEGLGFSMKWDMGWMNDTLSYFELDPVYRKYHHDKLTFSMMYAFGERYAMPISHDEVVHGKKSLIDRMPLEYEWKFAGVRAFMGYMMTHPGKKLMFMGGEIGQFREWDYEGEIEWFLLDYDAHARLQYYFSRLNRFYLENPALWERDDSWEGFQWINADDAENSVLTYRRLGDRDERGEESELIVAVNLTPVRRDGYRLYLPDAGEYREVFNSDERDFGGFGFCNPQPLTAYETPSERLPYAVDVTLPPMSVVILRRQETGGRAGLETPIQKTNGKK